VWTNAVLLAAGAATVVYLYTSVDVGRLRPLPDMYGPTWALPGKRASARENNQLRPTQAQTVIAAAILRHLHAVITTGQRWDPAIATHGTRPRPEPAAAA
jgi:hypothetical protein